MKQTAVEWLIDNWIKFNDIDIELDDFANLRPLLKQAKEMEKEQRKKDFVNGYKKKAEMSNSTFDEISEYAATEYFNETFNTKEK